MFPGGPQTSTFSYRLYVLLTSSLRTLTFVCKFDRTAHNGTLQRSLQSWTYGYRGYPNCSMPYSRAARRH